MDNRFQKDNKIIGWNGKKYRIKDLIKLARLILECDEYPSQTALGANMIAHSWLLGLDPHQYKVIDKKRENNIINMPQRVSTENPKGEG